MDDWSDEEVTLLSQMLDDRGDYMHHYPNEHDEQDVETFNSLRERVRVEAKQRKFWWAF
jgi:hypothetical protein